jgi:hypothetical protein
MINAIEYVYPRYTKIFRERNDDYIGTFITSEDKNRVIKKLNLKIVQKYEIDPNTNQPSRERVRRLY